MESNSPIDNGIKQGEPPYRSVESTTSREKRTWQTPRHIAIIGVVIVFIFGSASALVVIFGWSQPGKNALVQPIDAGKKQVEREPPRHANGERYDPAEDDPVLGPLIAQAEIAARKSKEVMDSHGQRGNCHDLWRAQKRILKEKHGIDWRTPAEMNPDIIFD
jgi:hypothetical protein